MKSAKGISLIVLVITIIVMIVLVGAIVLTLNSSGIIGKAEHAVEETNLATIKKLTQIAWAEAYAKGARTEKELQQAVDKALKDNEVDTDKYGINVTTSGVQVVKGWIQDGLTVKRGDTVLTIGDNFEYDETTAVSTNTKWQVLGASEVGELLILSSSHVGYLELGSDTDPEEAQQDWITAVKQLNDVCEPYGKGKSATGARSIKKEDIDKVTGFDKTTYLKGLLGEYGNQVTYFYNGTVKPDYTTTNGLSGTLTSTATSLHNNGFHYYDGKKFVVADLTATSGIITTLKNNYYGYNAKELGTLNQESKAYDMLFNGGIPSYWLANSYISTGISGFVAYSVGTVEMIEYVISYPTFHSQGIGENSGFDVRAVVSLEPDIQVQGSSDAGWTY